MLHFQGHLLVSFVKLHVSKITGEQAMITMVTLVLLLVCVLVFILWKNSRDIKASIKLTAQQGNLVRHDDRARTLCRAIHILNPHVTAGIDYVIRHDDPQQEAYLAEWMSDDPRPDEDAIRSALKEVQERGHEERYAAMRRAEYPSVGEQLDAAYQARQGDITRQREVDEQIRRVKEKYPKGEGCC
jgi:predicted lipid-binding transport protein (Tim44 family)